MLTTIAGRTFEHRETLKSMGARWDETRRVWTHARLSDSDRQRLRALGLTLTGAVTPPPPGIGDQPELPASTPIRGGTAHSVDTCPHHGSEHSYRGKFAEQKTLASFGFASLAEHVEFVRAIPAAISRDSRGNRNVGWKLTPERLRFTATADMAAALELAENGWQEGADAASEIVELLAGDHAKRKRSQPSLSGGNVNVGRMLAGNPRHMRKRRHVDGNRTATLYVDGGSPANVPANILIARAGVVAAISDMMENQGYSCEIVIVNTPTTQDRDISAYQSATRIKTAGDKLNISDIVFALGHAGFLRRIVFATVAVEPNCAPIWDNMGFPSPPFTSKHQPGRNEFHIKKIELNSVSKVRLTSTYDTAHSIFKLIAPDNLPIRLDE